MNLRKKATEFIHELFQSKQSKIFLFFAIIAIILGFIIYRNVVILLIQVVIYYLIIEHINCQLYGGCKITSWISTLIPVSGIIIFILDYFHVFKSIKDKVIYFHHKYEEITPEGKLDMKYKNFAIPL
jgi:hypothetical protein